MPCLGHRARCGFRSCRNKAFADRGREFYERALIVAELARHGGNGTRASEALGIARTTLHDKMRKYGLA